MITRIEATRYRALERLDTDLQAFAVLVGANGAGKTTFLDIPTLLGDCLRQSDAGKAFTTKMDERPPRSSGLKELVFCARGEEFLIAIEAELPENVISALLPTQSGPVQNNERRWLRYVRYEIRFEIFNQRQLVIGNEYLFLFAHSSLPERDEKKPGKVRMFGEAEPHRDWRFVINRERTGEVSFRTEKQKGKKARPVHVEPVMLALPRVQFETADDFPAARWLYELLTTSCIFYQPDLNLLQTASPPGLPECLMPNAGNLPWLVLQLQEDKERFEPWVAHVRTALPQVTGIKAKEREEDHHAYLVVTYHGGYEVTSSGLSEGTLRVMALTILPYLQQRPAVIITEQPEDGIHPQAIEAVLQSLGSVYDSQVLISSHSPVVLAMSKLDQILCSRVAANGAASIIKGTEHPRLKEWKGSIDLGSLFAAGVLR